MGPERDTFIPVKNRILEKPLNAPRKTGKFSDLTGR